MMALYPTAYVLGLMQNAIGKMPKTGGVWSSALGFLLALILSGLVLAQPAPTTPPPDFAPKVFEVARELRCPVCQGESAAESNAGVAVEMRRVIAEQLAQGKSKQQIKDFFVARYGDWILFEPPRSGATLWVWLSPFLGLGLLGYALWRYQATLKARAKALPSDVSDEEIARLESELK